MYTTIAYDASIGTGTSLVYVTPVADQHIRVEGNNVIVPSGMANLLGVYAGSTNIVRAQVESPSLRRVLLYEVVPLNADREPASPPLWANLFDTPIPLDEYEPLRALAYHSGGAAERMSIIVFLGDGAATPVTGDIYTVRAISSTTLTANAWTNGALTLDQVLPAGSYACVGFRAQSAGLIAARLVFVGGTWRPGTLGCDAATDLNDPIFRRGRLGVLGEFRHDQPPTVDFLSVSADTSEVVWLDLIKTG